MSYNSSGLRGQKNLELLLSTMAPILKEEEYVFCTIDPSLLFDLGVTPIATFWEDEGFTIIITRQAAVDAGLPVSVSWRLITLSVHSDLEAVGFLAIVTTALAKEGISVNAISAYFHDHLFVPTNRAEQSLACLQELASRGMLPL